MYRYTYGVQNSSEEYQRGHCARCAYGFDSIRLKCYMTHVCLSETIQFQFNLVILKVKALPL